MQRTTVFLGHEDREAIQTISRRYGLATESDAIRLAVRVLAASHHLTIKPPPRPKHGKKRARKMP